MADQQVAVLIDLDNVSLGSIPSLFDQISEFGRVVVKRAYADWSAAGNKKESERLLELGIEPVHLFRNARSGKNSTDIRLVIDAIDLLYSSPVDTFVVVSSDSDFVPLVSKLRAAGKMAVGAGRRAAVSQTFVRSCDRFIYLDDKEQKAAERVEPPRKESLMVRALRASMDEQGQVGGSRLYQTMQRLDPSFDFRSEGHSTFAKYLAASQEVTVKRSMGPGDMIVELADTMNADPMRIDIQRANVSPEVHAWLIDRFVATNKQSDRIAASDVWKEASQDGQTAFGLTKNKFTRTMSDMFTVKPPRRARIGGVLTDAWIGLKWADGTTQSPQGVFNGQ